MDLWSLWRLLLDAGFLSVKYSIYGIIFDRILFWGIIAYAQTLSSDSSLWEYHERIRHAKSRPAMPQDNSRLMRLPSELRNKIYGHSLRVGKVHFVLRRRPTSHSTAFSLVKTCRKIHEEARPIFYAINELCIYNNHLTHFPCWGRPRRCDRIPSHLNLVQNVAICVQIFFLNNVNGAISALLPLKNLRKLRIILSFKDLPRQQCLKIFDSFEEQRSDLHHLISMFPSLEKVKITQKGPKMYNDEIRKMEAVVQALVDARNLSTSQLTITH